MPPANESVTTKGMIEPSVGPKLFSLTFTSTQSSPVTTCLVFSASILLAEIVRSDSTLGGAYPQ